MLVSRDFDYDYDMGSRLGTVREGGAGAGVEFAGTSQGIRRLKVRLYRTLHSFNCAWVLPHSTL